MLQRFAWPVSECPEETRTGKHHFDAKTAKISGSTGWKVIILNKNNGDTLFSAKK
jgi:hypothetical protein